MDNIDKPGSESNEQQSSSEVLRATEALVTLSLANNKTALKVLCAGFGGEFTNNGITFRILEMGEGEAQLQINTPTAGYNFSSWEQNLPGLAESIINDGVTEEQLEQFSDRVSAAATYIS